MEIRCTFGYRHGYSRKTWIFCIPRCFVDAKIAIHAGHCAAGKIHKIHKCTNSVMNLAKLLLRFHAPCTVSVVTRRNPKNGVGDISVPSDVCEARRPSHCHSPQTRNTPKSTCCTISAQKSAIHVVVYVGRIKTQHSIVEIIDWWWSYVQMSYSGRLNEYLGDRSPMHSVSSTLHSTRGRLKPPHNRLSPVMLSFHWYMTYILMSDASVYSMFYFEL